MPEYIEREALLLRIAGTKIHLQGGSPWVCGYRDALQAVGEMAQTFPAEDVAPVVHGVWDITKEYNDVIDMGVVKYTCSVCKEYRLSATGLSQATNYCPNCGAYMKDGE